MNEEKGGGKGESEPRRFLVLHFDRNDLAEFVKPERVALLSDDDIELIAERVGEQLLDAFVQYLPEVYDYYFGEK